MNKYNQIIHLLRNNPSILLKKSIPFRSVLPVLALGISSTIGYGTLFYSFSLLSIELIHHFSWSKEFIYSIYSIGILLSACLAPLFGRIFDKFGPQIPMTLGSFCVFLGFLGMSSINSKLSLIGFLLFLEVVSLLVLYEAAFTAITTLRKTNARLSITHITLMGGFASTIFWPLIKYLLEIMDWRQVYQLMALMHLFICLPLHGFLLKNSQSCERQNIKKNNTHVNQQIRHDWFSEITIAAIIGLIAFCITGVQIHFFTLLKHLDISAATILIASALIGPSQVIARLLEMTFGQRISPIKTGLISAATMLIACLLLISSQLLTEKTVIIFALFFGIGQGLNYIIRGTLPLHVFGHLRYGTITGRINAVRVMMTALAPVSFAVIHDFFGITSVLTTLVFILVLACFLINILEKRQYKNVTGLS